LPVNNDAMNKQETVISRGLFKGKKIEFASTLGVDAFRDISEDFMKKVFGLDPGDYLITDESRLRDFVDVDETDLADSHGKIRREYGLDVSQVPSGNLLALFKRIHRKKSFHRMVDNRH
jgi:hypothetical protein